MPKIFFGSLATDYIRESGRELNDIAAKVDKLSANQFAKWRKGEWTYIPEGKLVAMIDEIAQRDRSKRVSLMIAYLIDHTPDIFRPLIDITPKTGEAEGKPELAGQRWSPSLRAKLEAIGRAYAKDEQFMKMADQLGQWAASINRAAEKG